MLVVLGRGRVHRRRNGRRRHYRLSSASPRLILSAPSAGHDPARLLLPSALAGGALLVCADIIVRLSADRYRTQTRRCRRAHRRPRLCAHRRTPRVAGRRFMSALLSLRNVSVDLGATRALADAISLEVRQARSSRCSGPTAPARRPCCAPRLVSSPWAVMCRSAAHQPANAFSARERALRAAYLPQRPQSIWPISVEALVALGRFAHGAAPDRLASCKIKHAVDAAIEACALGALRQRRMDEISGGEKARAHLARALAQHAPLLLLDEPTAGLDPAQALGVADILRVLTARRAARSSSQRMTSRSLQRCCQSRAADESRSYHRRRRAETALTPDGAARSIWPPARLERLAIPFAAIFER
jgi:ABC-type hemin transport system ATPase subunit